MAQQINRETKNGDITFSTHWFFIAINYRLRNGCTITISIVQQKKIVFQSIIVCYCYTNFKIENSDYSPEKNAFEYEKSVFCKENSNEKKNKKKEIKIQFNCFATAEVS